MSEEQVIRYCAPTLASLKTGSLFTSRFSSCEEMHRGVRALNRRLAGKGLRVLPLRYRDGRGLIYVYRPGRLRRDLQDARACSLLHACGYDCACPSRCVAQLTRRMKEQEEFPHEIGLFLGYPPEDVDGFIHRKHEAKCIGCWKVYGDVETAQRTFEKYKKCTDVYLRQWIQGRDIEKLTVTA